jgi:hypothetical protein
VPALIESLCPKRTVGTVACDKQPETGDHEIKISPGTTLARLLYDRDIVCPIAAGSRSHISPTSMWERLPAAIIRWVK